ncbi:adenylyltransferase/cytidyltransferase family protein [Myroides profundi]|uniref:Glycerol-3-phosphate cytidylyltransferase n=1 Tax=Myroides profundi TaxID=480520 RepID=A0AAJ4W732_MYRPR|nr:adenylyltransferase/cytidyltransferase family protein [Myroides profundi]AJH15298.1 glycerol-3-phosphate cytidylyltransferase [Myroides profundi]SER65626.1 Glycerol-3-phosphate cytidylyltransferase [Myroides profundi]
MKVGITFVAFEFLHSGYIQMLEEAKKQCDYLIVGLNTVCKDETGILLSKEYSLVERYITLKACKYVDEIIPYHTEQDLEDILRSFKIDIRILGSEYKTKDYTAKDYCKNKGIKIHFNHRDLKPQKVW